jgi:hypothetical protein
VLEERRGSEGRHGKCRRGRGREAAWEREERAWEREERVWEGRWGREKDRKMSWRRVGEGGKY